MKTRFLPLALVLVSIGCSPAEEEAVAPAPPKVTFEGTLDKSLVGKWKETQGGLTLDVTDDGKAHMSGTVGTPGGPKKVDEQMEWKTNGNKLLFHTTADAVQQYQFQVEGSKLTLKTSKVTTTYTKVP